MHPIFLGSILYNNKKQGVKPFLISYPVLVIFCFYT